MIRFFTILRKNRKYIFAVMNRYMQIIVEKKGADDKLSGSLAPTAIVSRANGEDYL